MYIFLINKQKMLKFIQSCVDGHIGKTTSIKSDFTVDNTSK